MLIQKSQVIVLKQSPFEESSLIVQALSSRGAKLSFIAKGARTSRKRFTGGVLEPGHFISVEYRVSKSQGLNFLNQAWFLKRFENLRKSYDHLKLACYFLNTIQKISQEGAEDSNLFDLLGNSLKALEYSQDLLSLKFVFEYKLLNCQGVLEPDLRKNKMLSQITVAEHSVLNLKNYEDLKPAVQRALQNYTAGK